MRYWVFLLFSIYSFAQTDTIPTVDAEDFALDKTIAFSIKKIAQDSFKVENSLADQLSKSLPVYIRNYGPGNIATLSYRGASSSQHQVLWNGIPINSVTLGQTDLNNLQSTQQEQLYFSFGGNTEGTYPGALGATISMENQVAFIKQSKLRVHQAFASFETQKSQVDFTQSSQKRFFTLNWNRFQSKNNFNYYNPFSRKIEIRKQAEKEHRSVKTNFAQKIGSRAILKVGAWYQNTHQNIPRFITTQAALGQFSKDQQWRAFTSLNWFKNNWKSKIQISTQNQEYNFVDSAINTLGSPLLIHQHFGQLVFQRKTEHWEISLDNQYSFNKVQTPNFKENKAFHFLFSKLRIAWHYKKNSIEIGSTPQYRSDFITKMDYYASIRRESNDWDYFIRWGNNHRFPTANDLYWNSAGNKLLKPEKNQQFEGGVKKIHKNYECTAEVYHNTIQNRIIWKPNTSNVWKPININQSQSYGIEINNKLRHTVSTIAIEHQLGFSFSRNIELTHQKDLPYLPSKQLQYQAIALYRNQIFRVSSQWVDRVFTNEDNSIYLPNYWILNFSWNKKIKISSNQNLSLGVVLSNVFNNDYQIVSNAPMPRRNFEINMTLFL
ncbi:MAG: TonB-dependent receptor [Flavobacteriales bacterium]|jgi:iron complex outermembrane receptor protein|nr:TonB-dependent receptor [Flavobacteriales bacterium]